MTFGRFVALFRRFGSVSSPSPGVVALSIIITRLKAAIGCMGDFVVGGLFLCWFVDEFFLSMEEAVDTLG